nr:hypothetical protein [Tanacetum cinerariifolium]
MTAFPEISRRARDKYHNLEDIVMVKNIINSGKHKDSVVMKIPNVPTTLSQPIESIQGTHRTLNAPRSPNPETDEGESNTIQLSLAEQKSHDELEAKENIQKVKEHFIVEEIEKLVEGVENAKNVKVNSFTFRKDDTHTIPGTKLEPKSDKESLKVEITAEVQPVNINEEEEESAEDEYQFMPRKRFNILAQHLQDIMEESLPIMVDNRVKELTKLQVPVYVAQGLIMERQQIQAVESFVRNYMSGHIMHAHMTQATPIFIQEQQQQLYLAIRDNPQLQKDDLPIWLALKYKFERLNVATTPCRPFAVRPRDQDDPHDDAHPEGENSAKRQNIYEHGTFVFRESSSGQDFKSKPCLSKSGNQEQLDDFDFWTDSYATDDDEIPNEKVSQELVDKMSHTVDEAKLRKVVDDMLRKRCTSGDELQYHID